MADIRHRVGIRATEDEVRRSLTTLDGLAGWWTTTVEGDPGPGGTLRFFFGQPDPAALMEVVAVDDAAVRWRCVEGPDDWVGTTVTFATTPSDGETVLVFTHGDWRQPTEFMHHCSTKWGYFLVGLKTALEGGPSLAFPNDMAISGWG